MLVGMGMPHIVNLVVTNNTKESVDSVKFVYNTERISTKLKNIKPNQNKIAGISTIHNVSDLKMIVNETSEEYLIKSDISKGSIDIIEISINKIDGDDCKFSMVQKDGYPR